MGDIMFRVLLSMYVSEGWYSHWLRNSRNVYARARAVVVHDRVLTETYLNDRVGIDTLRAAGMRP